ncbi:uncharacterized protein N7515_005878 [Penicillium bovifimosum]|uniref:Uncharacterized protein n=1 Tax=Penicillium bovifimosum TaxID=126998 RepID=A0A9W9GTK7_9EURO|nr:uncharacterized protein N7515_005878 [Penicillium bovifimosum]KAJ5129839.1 hypothetical protein N7515_005878 [Penicillium bovifimosum]
MAPNRTNVAIKDGSPFWGPEFIFQIALSQYQSAAQSVVDFKELKHTEWTMTHAFYADMGGFHLKARGSEPFPINAKQLHHLVLNKYVEMPTTTKRTIEDKNKVDAMLRFITVAQCLWFLITTLGRLQMHLPITTGELTTVAFILCSLPTNLCWISKPADVKTSEIIETSKTIEELWQENNVDKVKAKHYFTPMDYVDREEREWAWSIYWSNWVNILRNMRIVIIHQKRPITRFQNTRVAKLTTLSYALFLLVTAIYGGIFMFGWDYEFPTRVEQILWRVSSTVVLACTGFFWAIGWIAFTLYPNYIRPYLKAREWGRSILSIGEMDPFAHPALIRFSKIAEHMAKCIRNNSFNQDPAMHVPLKAILPIYVAGVLYCFSRAYIFLQDIIQLRSLPAEIFSDVGWFNSWPHV